MFIARGIKVIHRDEVEVNNMPCAINTLFANVAYNIFSTIVFYLVNKNKKIAINYFSNKNTMRYYGNKSYSYH
jgi:16S rRNA A1518/A1519 N6-dimethyltransferase RsmA/KsgA/DIM1 with predicted DNA glycosylase/AP lyase activity